jgi:hypothetical protein
MATVPCNFLKDRQRGLRFRHGSHIARGLDLMRRDEVFVPPTDYVCAWYDKLGSVPTSGVMTILLMTDLLRDRVGDILLAGFSFYQGRSHYYSDEVIVPQMHNPPAERTMLAEYLRDMTASGRVTLDPVMKQHLYPNHGA